MTHGDNPSPPAAADDAPELCLQCGCYYDAHRFHNCPWCDNPQLTERVLEILRAA